MDVGGALPHRLGEDAVDELDHRRVLGAGLHRADLGEAAVFLFLDLLDPVLLLDDRVGGGALQGAQPRQQRLDVLLGGDGDLAVEAGGDLDVVGGEHVGRVDGGDQQRLESAKPTGTAL